MKNDRRIIKAGDTRPPLAFATREGPINLDSARVTRSVDGGPFEDVEPIDASQGVVPLSCLTTLGTHTIEHEIHWGDGTVQSVSGEVDVVDDDPSRGACG